MEHKHISKGIYQYSQIGNFISVKNYIFIRKDEKKHLMLRFSNDFDYVVNSMTYFVIQMDNFGKVLARTKITNNDLAFQPGSMYVTECPICVDEYCSDFKIVFAEAVSGLYRYEVHSDMIAVHYIKNPEPIVDLSDLSKREKRKCKDNSIDVYDVEQNRYQERGVAAFISVIIAIAVLSLNVLNMFFIHTVSQNSDFIINFPYFGDFLDQMYEAFSTISQKLNFLSDVETVSLFVIVFFILFVSFLVINHVKKRKFLKPKKSLHKGKTNSAVESDMKNMMSSHQKGNFNERKTDEVQE